MTATLKSLQIGNTPSITFETGGQIVTQTLTVVAKTRTSITFRSNEFTGTWRVKFADVGSESQFSNKVISVG